LPAVACRECGAWHHKACWEANGGCAVLSCDCQAYIDLFFPSPTRVESVQVTAAEDITIPHISISEEDLSQLPAQPPHVVLGEGGHGGVRGEDSDRSPTPPSHIVLDMSDIPPEIPEIHCAYCHEVIKADEQAVACRKCDAPYHKECWKTIRRCATLGCKSTQYRTYHVERQIDQGQEIAVIPSGQTEETLMDKLQRLLRLVSE
jgi:hypothetical protein